MMPGLFTFTAPAMLTLLDAAPKLMPGIDKAVALYYNPVSQLAECKSLHRPFNEGEISDYQIQDLTLLKKLRQQKAGTTWVNRQSIEFEIIKPLAQQLNIFDEHEVMVLICGFKNQWDGQTDLLYLYLSSQNANLGLTPQLAMPTMEKHTIGILIYNSLNVLLEQHQTNREVLGQLNKQFGFVMSENARLLKLTETLQQSAAKSNIEVATETLHHICERYGANLELSEGALNKIKAYNGRHDNLMEAIRKAAVLSINLGVGQPVQPIQISEYQLELTIPTTTLPTPTTVNNATERDQRTIQLLDKLELAAIKVTSQHQKLTGENVGLAFEQPISAPAITDALKNHQKKVVKLMAEFPDKWNTIRNEFRPVINILTQQQTG